MNGSPLTLGTRAIARLTVFGGSMLGTLGLWELHARLVADELEKARLLEAYRRGWATAFLRALEVRVEGDPAPRVTPSSKAVRSSFSVTVA